jgi:hypothetical protein
MNLEDEIRRELETPPAGGRTLGEAANRYVTFQIIMTVVGLVIFLLILFLFFLPLWRGF